MERPLAKKPEECKRIRKDRMRFVKHILSFLQFTIGNGVRYNSDGDLCLIHEGKNFHVHSPES